MLLLPGRPTGLDDLVDAFVVNPETQWCLWNQIAKIESATLAHLIHTCGVLCAIKFCRLGSRKVLHAKLYGMRVTIICLIHMFTIYMNDI